MKAPAARLLPKAPKGYFWEVGIHLLGIDLHLVRRRYWGLFHDYRRSFYYRFHDVRELPQASDWEKLAQYGSVLLRDESESLLRGEMQKTLNRDLRS